MIKKYYIKMANVTTMSHIVDENSNTSDNDGFNHIDNTDIEYQEVFIKAEEITDTDTNDQIQKKIQFIKFSPLHDGKQAEEQFKDSSSSPDRQYSSSLMNLCNDSGIGSNDSEKEESPRKLCLVCGDIASGFHYGVASCEACKAFFKRSVQGNIEYTCPGTNDCEINKRRRKACQSCRFQKCLNSGMLKEGVRLDRVRGGRQKYRRSTENPNLVHVMKSSKSILMLENIQILQSLISSEPDILETDLNQEDTKNRNLLILSDLYDRELVNLITWAKLIPGFPEISLKDQMRILQSTWPEIITMSLVYRSLIIMSPFLNRDKVLHFASNFSMNLEEAKQCDILDFFQACCILLDKFEKLRITKEEYYITKALILANADVNVDDIIPVKNFREAILVSLNETLEVLRPNSTYQHIQELLLCLPTLRNASIHLKNFWIKVLQKHVVPMNRLFVEMLQTTSR